MLRENWIDFVCVAVIVGFGLVVGFVGCQRSAYKNASLDNSAEANAKFMAQSDGRARAKPFE